MNDVVPAMEPLPPPGDGVRQWLLPGGLGVFLIVILGVVLFMARQAGETGAPPKPAAFEPPREVLETVTLDVQEASGGRITFATGSLEGAEDVEIPSTALVERLVPMAFEDVQAGDWITVIGVPNGVRNYAIGSVVVMDGSRASAGDTELRTPGGFLGYEAARDASQRVILGGLVESVADGRFVVAAPGGPVTVWLEETEGAGPVPFLRLTESTVVDVKSGDRVAFPVTAEGKPDANASAVLVLDASAAGAPPAPAGGGGVVPGG